MVTSPKEHAAVRQPLDLHIIIGLSCDRLHASTACKAHPVGYRDIPRRSHHPSHGGDLFFSPQRRSSQRRSSQHRSSQPRSSQRRSSQRRSSQRRSSQCWSSQCWSSQRWSSQRRSSQRRFNMQQSGRRGCKSLPTCSGVPMGPPPSLQHAAEWQTWVQIPPYLQRWAAGATTFSSTCSRVADVGANPSLPAAVCQCGHHLLFNMQQSGRRGCKSLPTCSGVPMVPPPSLQHSKFSAET